MQIVLKSAFAINWGQCGQIDGVVILFEKGEYSFFSLKKYRMSKTKKHTIKTFYHKKFDFSCAGCPVVRIQNLKC